MTVIPPPYSSDLPPATFLLPKLKIPSLCYNWRDQGRIQLVLNTLPEHIFQDTFKILQKHWEWSYIWKGTISRMMVVSRPKLSFDQKAAPVPEIIGSTGMHLLWLHEILFPEQL
jgi:hypothetical protein